METTNVTTIDNDKLADDVEKSLEQELTTRGIITKSIEASNFSDINIDMVILYDHPKWSLGYYKSYYSIGRLRAKLEGKNGFEQITLVDFARLIIDHFEFNHKPPTKETPNPR